MKRRATAPAAADSRPRRPGPWAHLALGAGAGVALGVEARLFMRLLASEPEFTRGGTLVIIAVFGVSGAALSLARWGRVSGRTRWWRVASVPALASFLGQGLLLLPGVLAGALLGSGRASLRRAGWVGLLAPAVTLHLLSEEPMTLTELSGLLLFTGCAAVLGRWWRTAWLPWRAVPVGGGLSAVTDAPEPALHERRITCTGSGALRL